MAEQEQVVSTTRQMAKTATAVVIGGSLLLLSGVTLVATVIGLALATPLAVICSPVLVPAAITVFLIISGFFISAGFGMAAIFTTAWIYKYLTGKRPVGLDSLEQARVKIVSKARDVKEQYTH